MSTIYVTKPTRSTCSFCSKPPEYQDGCSYMECPCRKLWTAKPQDALAKLTGFFIAMGRRKQ